MKPIFGSIVVCEGILPNSVWMSIWKKMNYSQKSWDDGHGRQPQF